MGIFDWQVITCSRADIEKMSYLKVTFLLIVISEMSRLDAGKGGHMDRWTEKGTRSNYIYLSEYYLSHTKRIIG